VLDLLLTQEDIDVNTRNMHGETAMWRAAYAGRGSAVARLLQQNDLEIDVPDTFHGSTPFALAVANGHVDIAEALLDTNKVNINFRDREGRTPLHHAVLSKHKSLVLLLLSRKEIDIHIRDETNCTPLWCAAECGNLDAARLLLMYGANPNIRDFHGIRPLDNAISQRDTPMVELLLNQHNLEIPSHVRLEKRAQPPLCAAVCIGDADILRMLLCHVAEVNAYNYHGYQPLLLAVRKGDSSMVKLLLSHKDIDVNKRGGGRYGFTALHQAAYDGCLSILNMLLAHPGIDINAKDEWGTTPLWWATKNGHCLVVKRLLAESTLELDGFIELLLPLHHCR
jgi:ankyrin repeat protein